MLRLRARREEPQQVDPIGEIGADLPARAPRRGLEAKGGEEQDVFGRGGAHAGVIGRGERRLRRIDRGPGDRTQVRGCWCATCRNSL